MSINFTQLQNVRRYLYAEDLPGTAAYTSLMEARAAALTFKSKEEYLQWVAEWKAQYKELSQESRAAKKGRKASLPSYNPAAKDAVFTLRWQATVLLWLRQHAKSKSWKQKLEQQQVVKV